MDQPLTTLENVCRGFGFSNLLADIQLIRNENRNGTTLNIAVLGRFKAGKSSLINHLIGKEILPTGATPVTNVITRIRYGDNEGITVHYRDNHVENILLSELSLFVNEKENPGNTREIDFVDLTVPELKSFPHLRFIDTPGIGSLFSHNTSATQHWIPGTGVAVLAIDPGHPLSEDEMQFIDSLQKYTPDIRLLLTKTDLYHPKDLEEVEQFIHESVLKKWGKPFPVYRYSIVSKSQDYRKQFISQVLAPLEKDYTARKKEVAEYKIASLARECLGYLEMAQLSSEKNEKERKDLLKKILDGQSDIKRIREELRLIAEYHVSLTRSTLAERLLSYADEITNDLRDHFLQEYDHWRGNLFVLSRKFEQWTAGEISKKLSDIIEKEYPFFNSIREDTKAHFEKYLMTLQEQLNTRVREVLNIFLSSEKKEIGLHTLPPPDVAVSWAFDSNIDLLWFLFPMFIFKPVFGRYFERHIESEVEKNVYRLIGQVTEKINALILEMKEETLRRYELEITAIRSTLSRKPDNQASPADAIKEIRSLANR
ncbi:MAG: hypothetical protein GXO83_04850 [Chlorobi bacterium]|nr:hypothetical protein [Chlorobiota bacterium]